MPFRSALVRIIPSGRRVVKGVAGLPRRRGDYPHPQRRQKKRRPYTDRRFLFPDLLRADQHNSHAVRDLKVLEGLDLACLTALALVVAGPAAFQIADLLQRPVEAKHPSEA